MPKKADATKPKKTSKAASAATSATTKSRRVSPTSAPGTGYAAPAAKKARKTAKADGPQVTHMAHSRKTASTGNAVEVKPPPSREAHSKYATVGSATRIENGKIIDDIVGHRGVRRAMRTAGIGDSLFGSGGISDSGELAAYNFEFPTDALEMPQSRREELRYYNMAYDRDPLVGRGIDLHTELLMSKITLDKPKCSVESFADFVFDFYQSWVTEANFFTQLIEATREYFKTGEAFLFTEETGDTQFCEMAQQIIAKKQKGHSAAPESFNAPEGSEELSILKWLAPKQSKLDTLTVENRIAYANRLAAYHRKIAQVQKEKLIKPGQSLDEAIIHIQSQMGTVQRQAGRVEARLAALRTAAPGDENPHADDIPADAPEPLMLSPLERVQDQRGDDGDTADVGEGDAPPAEGGDEIPGGGAMPPLPSGGGGIGAPAPGGDDLGGDLEGAADKKLADMKLYLSLLERKKALLEELKAVREEKEREFELFSHVVNPEYLGPDRVVLMPPDSIEIKRDSQFGPEPSIFFKPSPAQKQAYLEDQNLDPKDRESLEESGMVVLNDDPLTGSYALHFARKKAPFEDHGRSILQRCMRVIIYREKLRQVQNTIVSRNMTPKTLIVAPDVPISELEALRVNVDEAKADPDYTIVVNYDVTWNEIGSEGRILALDSEWAHSNMELAIGLGFSPDILTGESLFQGNRINIELMNNSYLQFRDTLADLVEKNIFRPIAMKKGFYEIDAYGNPRWIYPKLSFSRLALRDSGDVYDMLFNLYSKGSLPVSIILEFMNVDPETCRRLLEADLFTVNDSKFNEILTAIYNEVGGKISSSTNLMEKIAQSLGLKAKDQSAGDVEGSGEGV